MQNLQFEKISRQEHDSYKPGSAGSDIGRYPLLEKIISGVGYKADVFVPYDSRGRVLYYSVSINRTAVNDQENDWVVRNARADRSHPIDVYQYTHNLALGVSAFYDNGPRIAGDSAKGL